MHELFNEVVNQNNAKSILQNVFESRRVPHAFLFYGPEGVGKFNTAIQFTKVLNSGYGINSKLILSKISSLLEPYIKLVIPLPRGKNETGEDSPTEKLPKEILELIYSEVNKKKENPYYRINIENANTIKINSIRDINKFINLEYSDINKRVVIIVNAHLMNDEAQNALLKNLEEPPMGVIFILLTSEKNKLLPTIISRCWEIDFDPLSPAEIELILKKFFKIEDEVVKNVSHFCDGSVYKAVQLLENDFEKMLEKTILILRYSLGKRYFTAYNELKKATENFTPNLMKLVIDLILKWFNDTMADKFFSGDLYFEKYRETIKKFNNRYTTVNLNETVVQLEKLRNLIDKNVNLNIISLCLIFELASITLRN